MEFKRFISANGILFIEDTLKYCEQHIRIFGTQCDPWFCGKDVANILGYDNTSKAIKNNVDDEDKLPMKELYLQIMGIYPISNNNSNESRTIYVNRWGLYSLISKSKLIGVKQFKKWINSEVLSLNIKHGGNNLQELLEEKEVEIKTMSEQMSKTNAAMHQINNFICNVKQRSKTEYIYIATTALYAKQNLFKVGGSSSLKCLHSRLATYNTGRSKNDRFYFVYIRKTDDYHRIERRIKDILFDFREKSNSEIYVLNYKWLSELITNIIDNNNEEIDKYNDFIGNILRETINREPHIPNPVNIDDI